ncbi:alpha/beta fold hydrolase [Streptomyces oceani]|uniref:Hydrolase n=1 Tax=Streptomyces oceani TaxID=1075402 RepID=A0A1E7JZ88_9ACTN|nr:alpha/beta fold hydrolase [Streptomyces oceani]OEU96970.1 hydrolase [Streptomyces oceani]
MGAGEPLVLVHGHPFDRTMWRPQAEHFAARGWRVIVPDLRGYGESEVIPGKTPLETFAGDIAALLDHLGVGDIVLGGLSMGGQIVMDFHRQYPERLRALLLADTSAPPETEEGVRRRRATADRLVHEGMAPYADEVLAMMVAPANIEALPEVAEHVLRMMRDTPPEGAAAALRGRAERPDYVSTLSRAEVPTLVVVGREDEFTPLEDAELLRSCVPGAELVVVQGAAHMPNLERTAEFDDALGTFLDRLSR